MLGSTGNSSRGAAGGSGLVFLIDDEPLILELAEAILRPIGYRVASFRDGASALEAYGRTQPRPKLVITDFAMPGMDGLRLMEECRRISPDQKVLLLSGTVGEELFKDAPVKPDGFLGKPFQPQQLVRKVRSLAG